MSALLFDSLEIRGFRAFRDLRIEKLGRVNLIVGQNNVGKSCLLEALHIYANRAHPTILWQLLDAHDEDAQPPQLGNDTVDERLSIVRNLFYDWPEITGPVAPIEIGPIDSPETKLRLSLEFCTSNGEKGQITPQPSLPEEHTRAQKVLPCFAVQLGESRQIIYPLEIPPTSEPCISEVQPINCIFTDAHSLDKREISALWDKVASPAVHQEVLNALRIIAPGLNDIDMVGGIDTKRDYFPIVTATTIAKPLPIRTLGTGIQRMLTIMLALLNAKDGLLLIDEIEHGLHYTAQFELWILIFEIARRLNIQVFATSHSWDCIVAFQEAAREVAQEDEQDKQKEHKSIQNSDRTEALLFRLSYKGDDLGAVLYDTQMLKVAARQDIEVR